MPILRNTRSNIVSIKGCSSQRNIKKTHVVVAVTAAVTAAVFAVVVFVDVVAAVVVALFLLLYFC